MSDNTTRTSGIIEDLAKLYDSDFNRMVKRVSYRVGGKINGEDVVQEAFCRAIKYVDTFEPGLSESKDSGDELRSWFNTLLNNAARDFKRQEDLEGMGEEGSETLDSSYLSEEIVAKITEDVSKMSGPAQKVIEGYFLLGRKPREIAKYSPLSPSNIRVTIHRFKKEMNRKYKELR